MENEGNSTSNVNQSNYFKTPTGILIPKKKNKSKKKKNKWKQKHLPVSVKKDNILKKGKLHVATMNSWEEAFTKAAAWQYKHQIAFWKAKAMALQCENRILHDIIRKNHGASTSEVSSIPSEVDSEHDMNFEDCDEPEDCVPEGKDPDLEVSEAFIQFLSANAKFKEEARLERERIKAQQNSETEDDIIKRMEAPPARNSEDHTKELQNLYGSRWREVSALEVSSQTQFISDCDRHNPTYWPNIPFNFNYS